MRRSRGAIGLRNEQLPLGGQCHLVGMRHRFGHSGRWRRQAERLEDGGINVRLDVFDCLAHARAIERQPRHDRPYLVADDVFVAVMQPRIDDFVGEGRIERHEDIGHEVGMLGD